MPNSMKGIRVMTFGAHGADHVNLCGGTMAKYASAGAEVMAVSLTYGAKSHSFLLDGGKPITLEEVKELKKDEIRRACEILGVQHIRDLDFEDSPLEIDAGKIGMVVELIREFEPTFILSHHPHDVDWWDHRHAGKIVLAAYESAEEAGRESKYEPWRANNLFFYHDYNFWNAQFYTLSPVVEPNVFIDVSDTIQLKEKAMMQFGTQFTEEEMRKTTPRHEGFWWLIHGIDYAEAFLSMHPPVLDYFQVREKGGRLSARKRTPRPSAGGE